MSEESKYPIGDAGENFDPEAMEDYDRRHDTGEFKDLTTEQIRRIYVEEEMDRVEQQENDEMMQDQIDREERENDDND